MMAQDDIERRLWRELRERSGEDCDRMVRLAEYGCQSLPAQKEQITNIIAHWRNRGLVETAQADTRVTLTRAGMETEDPTNDR
jgi:predicted NAD/FAD-dependent oxidoreductase